MTITEALAEIKTIEKRINSKREFVRTYLCRHEGLKDPLEKDGGSAKMIQEAEQAIWDLELRIVDLRHAIAHANVNTPITIEGEERSVADWLTWRREIAPNKQRYLGNLMGQLNDTRKQAQSKGYNVLSNVTSADAKPTDILVNIDEKKLSSEIEKMANILGQLDGQLSLKNATVMVA